MVRLLSLGLAPALLAGCATAVGMTPPALTYVGRGCADAPNLAGAYSLTPDKPKKLFTVATAVDGTARCLDGADSDRPYLVYALPQSDVRMIELGAQLEPTRIFSPDVAILDAEGRTVRTFAPDQYLFRGDLFSVQFVPQPGERFVLVSADPGRIGKDHEAIATGVNTTTYYNGYSGVNVYTGYDEEVMRTFSYEGTVVARVHAPEEDR